MMLADGLALCALIHHFHPELIPFHSLRKENKLHNINVGLNAASKARIYVFPLPIDSFVLIFDCSSACRS
jgi:hypothetical protein